ncbi:TonB-dependent receptor [Rubrivivax albus]|uniref:TonB-dependent siderophore receptor n=1 Tax=Rubrivivax albus TaxID=2499835 RepID=A0A3S2TME8_9BURK|nr:TonB-dependent receptor [Rubrivivax albus]RVT51721.1 TonB-dependent siderophore receptor [Rubrivivax albus]
MHRLIPFALLPAALAAHTAFAQTAPAPDAAASAPTLAPVPVRAKAETDKDTVRATTTRIGKGQQELRDIPQSVTVVTERLLDDRNLDTLKDTLRSTAGITFQAAEGQEEDIRLRGFALQSTGDIFLDGMRDPGFYDRDSFNWDRLEVLKGSASMLFGRGSTGGAVNQVNKQPFGFDQNEMAITLGSGNYLRGTLDLNKRTGDDAAFRVNAVLNTGDNQGNKIDKWGIAPTYRFGIGTADEISVGLYHLEYKNGIHYGFPWLDSKMWSGWKPDSYYGAESDYMAGGTTYATATHTHRFTNRDELRTVLRVGRYNRDQRASAIRFCQPGNNGSPNANCPQVTERITFDNIGADTVLNRGANAKIQDMEAVYLQSDYSGRFGWFGLQHEVLAGMDLAIEDFTRYSAVAPAGFPGKGTTTIGSPGATGSVDESLRNVYRSQQFDANGLGLYAQDLVQVAPAWKVLAGLRWDRFKGDYTTYATNTNNGATIGDVTAERGRSDSLLSKRLGVLYQPSEKMSFHFSYGTSFNTSGDTYSFDVLGENTPPEKSRNLELGGSLDWAQGRFTTRFALFHATKYNERNRDEESVNPTNYILSGQRHAAGLDLDFAGRITPEWELFAAYTWIPDAEVDKAASVSGTTLVGGETVGARPAMTAVHSGTVWTTYRLTPKWRVGGGLNARGGVKPLLTDFYAEKYVTADLMAEYDAGPAIFKLNLTNVTDKLYADQLYRGHFIPGKGRTLQLTVTSRF